MVDNKLTTIDFWVDNDKHHFFKRYDEGHGIDDFIIKYIPTTKLGSCLEIGSFPGPHLATFGDLGYALNGVDFHPLNKDLLPAWLQQQGFTIEEFVSIDFFKYSPHKKFDVVASFGFIEHFVDYEDMIQRHINLVNDNGYIIITTPNFKGLIQKSLHIFFDKINLSKHNIESMQPTKWKKILEDNNFEIIYYGYFGDFWFWHGAEKLPKWKTFLLWFVERAVPRIRKLLWFQSSLFSAYAGIVAVKKTTS